MKVAFRLRCAHGATNADRDARLAHLHFTYATLAAKSRRAEVILVPLLDFLQSVPILSFSITILFFLQLTPGRVASAEMGAAVLIRSTLRDRKRDARFERADAARLAGHESPNRQLRVQHADCDTTDTAPAQAARPSAGSKP
jgi:hypothetical protein